MTTSGIDTLIALRDHPQFGSLLGCRVAFVQPWSIDRTERFGIVTGRDPRSRWWYVNLPGGYRLIPTTCITSVSDFDG